MRRRPKGGARVLKWHAAAGAEDNGVALCAFHHKALDRGAISLDDDLRLVVSLQVSGDTASASC